MGYRSSFSGSGLPTTPGAGRRGVKTVVHTDAIPESATLEAYFKRNEEKDRFTTSYNKSFTQPSGARLRLGGLHPLAQDTSAPRTRPLFTDHTDLEASIRPSSTGFASNAFDSVFELDRFPRPCDLHHSQSDPLMGPQSLLRARGGLMPLRSPSASPSDTTDGAWGTAVGSLARWQPEGHGGALPRPDGLGAEDARPESRGGGWQRPGSRGGAGPGLRPGSRASRGEERLPRRGDSKELPPRRGDSKESSASAAPSVGSGAGERKRSKAESYRSVVELLSNPDLKRIAHRMFDSHDPNRTGHLSYSTYCSVLQKVALEMGLRDPDAETAQRLFTKYDVDCSNTLDFNEFLELLLGLLRQNAFDRSAIFGRDFFVQKHQGSVWDRYEKMLELGSGTFGTALLVKQRLSGEQQVVKAVRKSRVQIPVEDVEREILVLRQLDHPHVVRLRRWYEDKHSIYLVMDYLRGGSLKDKILEMQRQDVGVRERFVRAVTQQVLQGMAYCHDLRLIHKDLKDENIMLLKSKSHDTDKEPFAVIIDLGMAEIFSPMDKESRHIAGTPVTMSPQVWSGTFGPKCDVWSLGCVLYQFFTGRMPFAAKSMKPEAWISEHRKGADWSQVKSSFAGRELCKAMLTFSEEERPSMAACLRHDWFAQVRKAPSGMKPAQFAYLQEEYVKGSALKRALLLELASALPMEDADRIVDVFKEFDADDNGKVSLEEAQEAFEKKGLVDGRLALKTFQALDLDQDGALSFTEFSSWLLPIFEDLMEDRLYKMFAEYNENPHCQALDTEGVKRFLRGLESMLKKGSIGRSSSLLKELRSGTSGTIAYEELKQRLLGPSSSPQPRAEAPPHLAAAPDAAGGQRPGVTAAAPAPAVALPLALAVGPAPPREEEARLLPIAGASPSRGRSRFGLDQSLKRLRMMYSSRA